MMNAFRRRMVMAASVKDPDVPTEELDYLTIIPLHEEGVEYYIYPYGGTNDIDYWNPTFIQDLPFYYRLNNGDWIEVNLPKSEELKFKITLNKDTELQLKCMGCNYSFGYADDYIRPFQIKTNGTFNIKGTPMSLVYGDGFKENNYVGNDLLTRLFYNNTGLTQILNPKTFLPYTELGNNCYAYMFYDCNNLINAPELPATTLANHCYRYMFYGCTKLNYIKMLATDISATGCLDNWVNGVSPTGTFVKHLDMTSLPTSINGIPEGWTVVNDGEKEGKTVNNVVMTVEQGGILRPLTVTMEYPASSLLKLEYTTDNGITWREHGATIPIGYTTFSNTAYHLLGDSVQYRLNPSEDDVYIYQFTIVE